MAELDNFLAMLVRAGESHEVHTSFADGDVTEDAEGHPLPEKLFTNTVTRVTMHGGSGMHAEAEFDAEGKLLGIGRLEHY